MNLFLAVASLGPSYGGPARSVSRLAESLARSGVRVGLWAPDQSAAGTPFLADDSPVERLTGDAAAAMRGFGTPDVIHDNGIWLPHNHQLAAMARKAGTPRVISVRGMLEPWALKHRQWKKKLAWRIYQEADLKAAACHHVTSAAEAETVRGFGWDVPVASVPNGIDLPGALAGGSGLAEPDRRTVLFLGRIHPVKGLPMLVEAWKTVRPGGWSLKIVGPDEGGHQEEVESLVREAGVGEEVVFTGPLDGEAKAAAYREASLFVMPSHTENFGMAIGEALAHGLPVITTTGTPWEVLRGEECGWWVEASTEAIAEALAAATAMPPGELAAMGQRGAEVAARDFAWEAVAERMRDIYEWLLKGGSQPEAVVGASETSPPLVQP